MENVEINITPMSLKNGVMGLPIQCCRNWDASGSVDGIFQYAGRKSSITFSPKHKNKEKYLCENGIEIETHIEEKDLFKFNYQGQIREIFEDENLKADKYLAEFFPNEIDAQGYRKIVDRELERLYTLIERKCNYDDQINQLLPMELLDEEEIRKRF